MFVASGLEEQGGLVHEQIDTLVDGPLFRRLKRLEDVRVDDGIQALDPLGVAEDLIGQVGAVERPVVTVGRLAEFLDRKSVV